MTQFLGTTSGSDGGIPFTANDGRLRAEWFDDDAIREVTVDAIFVWDGLRSPWWPRGGALDASGAEMLEAIWYDRIEVTRGHSGMLGFSGVTRDVYGTAVGNCVVKLFRTVDDSLQYSGTSASDGTYTATTPYSDAHYLYAYKDDAIDTAGATVNTLIPA